MITVVHLFMGDADKKGYWVAYPPTGTGVGGFKTKKRALKAVKKWMIKRKSL